MTFLNTLSHRGPDNKSILEIENGLLGHTRLSIFDLSSSANQPFESVEGNFTGVGGSGGIAWQRRGCGASS